MAEPKRTYKLRKIKEEHINLPEFNSWVTKIPNSDGTHVFCKRCKKTIQSGLTSLRRHMVNDLIYEVL